MNDCLKKPSDYDLKKWVSERSIVALRIYYLPNLSGEDNHTYWILTSSNDENLRLQGDRLPDWLRIKPDHCSVARLENAIVRELREWEAFAEEEAADLAEYERLKRKFRDE